MTNTIKEVEISFHQLKIKCTQIKTLISDIKLNFTIDTCEEKTYESTIKSMEIRLQHLSVFYQMRKSLVSKDMNFCINQYIQKELSLLNTIEFLLLTEIR